MKTFTDILRENYPHYIETVINETLDEFAKKLGLQRKQSYLGDLDELREDAKRNRIPVEETNTGEDSERVFILPGDTIEINDPFMVGNRGWTYYRERLKDPEECKEYMFYDGGLLTITTDAKMSFTIETILPTLHESIPRKDKRRSLLILDDNGYWGLDRGRIPYLDHWSPEDLKRLKN